MELAAADGVRRVALGRHGTVSADRARKQAAALLAGDAPAETTVAELARRYMREYVEVRCKPATVAQYRLTIDRHILPALGGAAIAGGRAGAGRRPPARPRRPPGDGQPGDRHAGAADRAGRRLGARPAGGQSLPGGPQIPGAAARAIPDRARVPPARRRAGRAGSRRRHHGPRGGGDPPAGAHRLPPQRDPDAALGRRAARCRRAPAARFEDRAQDGADLPGGGENPWRTAENPGESVGRAGPQAGRAAIGDLPAMAPRARPRRARRRQAARPPPLLRQPRAGARREPADDRPAARPRQGADHIALRPSRARHGAGGGRQGGRGYRRRHIAGAAGGEFRALLPGAGPRRGRVRARRPQGLGGTDRGLYRRGHSGAGRKA